MRERDRERDGGIWLRAEGVSQLGRGIRMEGWSEEERVGTSERERGKSHTKIMMRERRGRWQRGRNLAAGWRCAESGVPLEAIVIVSYLEFNLTLLMVVVARHPLPLHCPALNAHLSPPISQLTIQEHRHEHRTCTPPGAHDASRHILQGKAFLLNCS